MAIYIPIVMEYNDKASKAAQASLGKLAAGAGIAGLGMAQLGSFLADASKAAIEDERSQRLLAKAIQQNTVATAEQVAQQEGFIAQTQDTTKVLDDKLRPAYATLIRYTKSLVASQDLLETALNISAGTGKDLESVASALGKAYDGNYVALKRLGVPIDDSIIKAKDFSAAWRDLNTAFEGSQAAATQAEGAIGDLRIEWENFKEQTGGFANWAVKPFVQFGAATLEMLNYIADGVKEVTAQQEKLAASTRKVAQAAQFRSYEEKMNLKWSQMKAEADKKAADASGKAAAKARELASANRDKLNAALDAAKSKLDSVTESMTQYRDSISSTLSGMVSLDDALSTAQDSEDAYTEALKERAAAYEALAQAKKTVYDPRTGMTEASTAEQIADATERLAQAEKAVTQAQAKRTDYSTQFANQISAAKTFGEDLKKLVEAGLQQAGLSQLLNMGPIAGSKVAKDLLAGVGGLTVGGINESLAGLAATGAALGQASGMQIYGGELLSAQQGVAAVRQGISANIYVTSADPQKVVDALVAWSRKHGALPPTVKVS